MQSRKSKQRELVLKVLTGTKSHPDAEWIYEQARREMPGISLGTVYRNLRLLKERGEVQEILSGTSGSRYDATVDNHYHLRCLSCGSVIDIDVPVRQDINFEVERATGFSISHHHLEFHGFCPSCRPGAPLGQSLTLQQ